MSILHKMISVDEIKCDDDRKLYYCCPTGFVPVLVQKHQKERTDGQYYVSQETLYVPEYYNNRELKPICRDFWEKKDPQSSYTINSKGYEHRMTAILEVWHFDINKERNGFTFTRFLNDENDKVAKKYREGLTGAKIEWGYPLDKVSPIGYKLWTECLDEDLRYISYSDAETNFLEGKEVKRCEVA